MTPKPSPSAEVVLYTRAGCHLCDEAKEQIRRIRADIPFTFAEVDIDRDPALRDLYNEEVPVVFIRGEQAFRYRIDPSEFRKKLKSRSGV